MNELIFKTVSAAVLENAYGEALGECTGSAPHDVQDDLQVSSSLALLFWVCGPL